MRIEVGPYESAAVCAWSANARRLLDYAVAHRSELPISLPLEAVDNLRWYLQQWETAATKGDKFHWSAEIPASEMRTLLTYWVNLDRVTNERTELPFSTDEARSFYPAVVGELLDALEKEPGQRAFSRRLRAAWPGLGDDCEA